jgi:peptide/nickel transport system permease protein
MQNYIIRRVALIFPTLILVSIIVFMGLRFIPGDIVDLMISQASFGSSGISREEIKIYLGMDLPVHEQYLKWVGGILRGDFGESLWTRTPITDNLLSGLPVSLELGFMAVFLSLVIAIPVGVLAGIRPESKLDYLLRSVAIFLVCIPDFWLATMIVIYPALWWNVSPSLVYIFFWDDPLGNLGMVFLPALVLGFAFSGMIMRLTRNLVIEEMGQDYVRTARSKGLKARVVVLRHVLKNTLIPVVTVVGIQLPFVIGGAVVVESIFGLPGLGKMMLESINTRDYPIISGINIILATVVLSVNLLVDISYAWLDPRIRYR